MKRFHVHAHVDDLKASVAFYSKLFAAEPTRLESDYAKWMIEDPRINFAISTRGGKPGVDHLGFQTDSDEELVELKERAQAADMAVLDEGETTCCYARSEKHWVTDPQGIAWEHFHTLDSIPTFSQDSAGVPKQAAACCGNAAPRGRPVGSRRQAGLVLLLRRRREHGAVTHEAHGPMTRDRRDPAPAAMSTFERYLTLWVFLCIVAGIVLGQSLPAPFQAIGRLEIAKVNLPVGVLIWVMIIPMLLKVDFGALAAGPPALARHRRHAVRELGGQAVLDGAAGLDLHPPRVRALAARRQLDSYVAGLILLAAAPCTAMVFVWSRLTNGDPFFTLSQVALNDTIMVFAFAPIVALLLGLSSITVPWDTLLTSVVLYIVIPVVIAQLWRKALLRRGSAALRCRARADRPVVDRGAAGDAGAAVRVPGRGDPRSSRS